VYVLLATNLLTTIASVISILMQLLIRYALTALQFSTVLVPIMRKPLVFAHQLLYGNGVNIEMKADASVILH
jgi:hypothetical protein